MALINIDSRLRLRQKLVGNVGLQVAGLGLRAFTLILLANSIGADGFGVVALVIAIGSFASLPLGFGLKNSAIHFVPVYETSSSPEHTEGFLFFASILIAASTVAAVGCIVSFAKISDISLNETLVLGVVYGGMLALLYFYIEVLKALQMPLTASLYGQVVPNALFMVLLGVSFVKISPILAAVLLILSVAITFAVIRIGMIQKTPPRKSFQIAYWLKYSIPLSLSGASVLILSQGPVLVLSAYSLLSDAGGFAAAFRFASIPSMAIASLNFVIAPKIVTLWREKKIVEARREMRTLYVLLAVVVFIVCMFVLYFGDWFFRALGSEFEEYSEIFLLMCFSITASTIFGPSAYLLTALGKKWEVVGVYVVVTMSALLATFYFAGKESIEGIAWSVSVAAIVQCVVHRIYLEKFTPI